jgi:hypothetical protein
MGPEAGPTMHTLPASPSTIEAVVVRPGEPVNADAILAAARRLGLDLRPGVVFDRRAARCDLLGLLAIERWPRLRREARLTIKDVKDALTDVLCYAERAGLEDGHCGRPPMPEMEPTRRAKYMRRYREGRDVMVAAKGMKDEPACRGR